MPDCSGSVALASSFRMVLGNGSLSLFKLPARRFHPRQRRQGHDNGEIPCHPEIDQALHEMAQHGDTPTGLGLKKPRTRLGPCSIQLGFPIGIWPEDGGAGSDHELLPLLASLFFANFRSQGNQLATIEVENRFALRRCLVFCQAAAIQQETACTQGPEADQVTAQGQPIAVTAVQPGDRIDFFAQQQGGQRQRRHVTPVPGVRRKLDTVNVRGQLLRLLQYFTGRRVAPEGYFRGHGE